MNKNMHKKGREEGKRGEVRKTAGDRTGMSVWRKKGGGRERERDVSYLIRLTVAVSRTT